MKGVLRGLKLVLLWSAPMAGVILLLGWCEHVIQSRVPRLKGRGKGD